QTIRHMPFAENLAGYPSRGTLQIGEPAVIANKTGILTVADFRAADMAVGGQGAPLAPFFDYTFFTHKSELRILLNIGGIANFTYLPASAKIGEVLAFDSGPGNMMIDGAMQYFFDLPYDNQGKIASEGIVDKSLLARMKQHPNFQKPWPKSTGREEFGANFIQKICEKANSSGMPPENAIKTVTRLTAETISEAIQKSLQGKPVDVVFVSGGGRRNRTLMQMLEDLLEPARLLPIERTGMSSDAKEAVCFAHLASKTLQGKPANVPHATGANRSVVLGKICLP
ncbi:MAG: anhydro-N-acetylmuramic acid kinase, partial [bacterium]